MAPELRAAVAQITRFLRGAGFSLPKALLIVSLLVIGIALLAGVLTFVAVWAMCWLFLNIYTEASGTSIGEWIPAVFGQLAGIGMFFFLTVGIILMIDELRGWLLKLLGAGGVIAAFGGLYAIFLPVVKVSPLATACLSGIALSLTAASLLAVFGHGTAVKSLGGFIPGLLGVVLAFSIIFGGGSQNHKKAHSTLSTPDQIVLTADHPEEGVTLQPGERSLLVTAPGSKCFDPVPPSEQCSVKIIINEKGEERNLCPWPKDARKAGYVQGSIRSYRAVAGSEPVTILFKSSFEADCWKE